MAPPVRYTRAGRLASRPRAAMNRRMRAPSDNRGAHAAAFSKLTSRRTKAL